MSFSTSVDAEPEAAEKDVFDVVAKLDSVDEVLEAAVDSEMEDNFAFCCCCCFQAGTEDVVVVVEVVAVVAAAAAGFFHDGIDLGFSSMVA